MQPVWASLPLMESDGNKSIVRPPKASCLHCLPVNNFAVQVGIENGWTPLHLAIVSREESALKKLLQLQADPNTTDSFLKIPVPWFHLCSVSSKCCCFQSLSGLGTLPHDLVGQDVGGASGRCELEVGHESCRID